MLSTPKKTIHSRFAQLSPIQESDKKERVEQNHLHTTQAECYTQSKYFESPSHLLNLTVMNSNLANVILFSDM